MNDDDKQHSDEVALFRHGLIGELAHFAPGTKGLYARLKEKAGPTPPDIELLIRAVIALKERNAELEAKLARAKRKLAKLKQ